MPNITLSVSEKLKTQMDELSEVSWSDVSRRAIRNYIEARGSTNPIARAKYLELKEKEVALGYSFGLQLSEIIIDELDYQSARALLKDIRFIEEYDGENAITTWINNEPLIDPYYTLGNKMFQEFAKEKGSFAWLLSLASQKEDFHRNFEFAQGIIKALREIFR